MHFHWIKNSLVRDLSTVILYFTSSEKRQVSIIIYNNIYLYTNFLNRSGRLKKKPNTFFPNYIPKFQNPNNVYGNMPRILIFFMLIITRAKKNQQKCYKPYKNKINIIVYNGFNHGLMHPL